MSGHTCARTPPRTRSRALSFAWAVTAAVLSLCGVGAVSCGDDAGSPVDITSPADARFRAGALSWRTVSSPNRGTLANELKGIAIASGTDIWAVGEWNPTADPAATPRRTLIEHWNGSSWQLVPSPNATWTGVDLSTLEAAAAVSSSSVWAVGHAADLSTLKSTTLIMRWNGARWTIVPSPNPGGANLPNRLYDVAVVSPNDAWAVGEQGFREQGFPYRALILHWNGTSWRNVANSCGNSLYAITAISATDLWAVGEATTCRFNGQSWVRVAPAEAATFLDVSAVSPSFVWAVGREVFCGPYSCWSESRLARWDGSRWTDVTHPLFNMLTGVDAVTANDAWAVGDRAAAGGVLHWNGTAWRQVLTPRPGLGSLLNAVEAVGATRTWAVGRYLNGSGIPRTWTIRR